MDASSLLAMLTFVVNEFKFLIPSFIEYTETLTKADDRNQFNNLIIQSSHYSFFSCLLDQILVILMPLFWCQEKHINCKTKQYKNHLYMNKKQKYAFFW